MTKTTAALIFSGFVVALAGALTFYALYESPKDLKLKKLGEVRGHDLHRHGKAAGSLIVEITNPDQVPARAGERMILVANVESTSDLSGLKFVWMIPPGVRVERGLIEGELGDLENGSSARIPLAIVPDTDENKQIHLRVYRDQGSETIGQVAQYNTVDQQKIDRDLRTKAERLHEERGSESEHFKIVQ